VNPALPTLGVKLASYVAGAVVSIFVARALGPHDRGVWSVALLCVSILALLADGGLSGSVLYVVRNQPERSRAGVRMSFALVALGLIFWTAVALFLGDHGWLPVRSVSPPLVPILAGGGLCVALTMLGRQLLTGYGDVLGANQSVLMQTLLLPPSLVVAITAFKATASVALTAYVAVLASTLIVTLWRLLARELVGPASDRRLARTLVTYGLQSQVAALALILAYRSDLFLVDNALGPSAAGVYSIALTLSEILRGVPETAQVLVLSHAMRGDLADQAARVARQAVVATMMGGLSMMTISIVLVPFVFGEPYRGAISAFACLVPGVMGLAVSYSISPLLFLEGRIRVSAGGAIAALATLWLAGLYGPGAITLPKIATASSLAYWILAAVQMAALHRTARLEALSLVPGKADVASVIDAVVGLLASGRRWVHTHIGARPPGTEDE
jgi:O-antigen/teichoic acid export membrane protein